MKTCPKCGRFDSNDDYCFECNETFSDEEGLCKPQCIILLNGEINHHKDCVNYKNSMTHTIDTLMEMVNLKLTNKNEYEKILQVIRKELL